MGSKRKQYHRPRQPAWDQYSSPNNAPKRRRLSHDMNLPEQEPSSPRKASAEGGEHDEDEGWTKVPSKSSKRSKCKDDKQHRDKEDYPRLRVHQNYQSEIRLKDLRDLGLYVLADEVAPKWTAVANAKSVKNVTVIMVPGLDEEILRRASRLLQKEGNSSKSSQNDDRADSNQPDRTASPATGQVPQLKMEAACRSVTQVKTVDSHKPFTWLFQNLLHVKGPGDAKMSKVHSPLQALLLSQEVDKKDLNRSGHASERTPITEFIHSPDELREAEFPIHPASFVAQLDADLEATRREKTGQSASDGWVDTNVRVAQPVVDPDQRDLISQGLAIYAVDCEMVQTSDGVSSLARMSLISYPDGKVIIDKYVKPDLPVVNYFTQYSGITPQILARVTTTLKDIQQELHDILTPSAVLLGHSLDSDLNALKMTHPFLVDTSIIYPHPRGLPLRSSLKFLTNKYLKREIQTAGAIGHNSVEDALAVLDLVKMKCEKGPKWGTIEANGEPVFKRLKRNGRTSAMVEYGTPERGFGKDATYTIGCQTDDEIVKGVKRVIQGDNFFDFEIPAGGVDFVWGRLRALEFARGWVSGASSQSLNINKDIEDAKEDARKIDSDDDKIGAIALETLTRLQQIYDALPPKALLMLCSGTSDVRPVMRLQAQQQQYRKEFKVKKWDELTIKWTDTEEQALKKACEEARAGWAVCTIK